jgi:hypothetical protein
LTCCALLVVGSAQAPPAPQAEQHAGSAAVTVSECHVYAYLRDTFVTRQQQRKFPIGCTAGEARRRDV